MHAYNQGFDITHFFIFCLVIYSSSIYISRKNYRKTLYQLTKHNIFIIIFQIVCQHISTYTMIKAHFLGSIHTVLLLFLVEKKTQIIYQNFYFHWNRKDL